MVAYRASAMSLKIGDGAVSEVFISIGGISQYALKVSQQLLDATDLEDSSSAWRHLESSAGARFVQINASGIFTDSNAEQQLSTQALTGVVANFQCCFANGDVLQGPFIVQEYYRAGNIESEEVFRISLESAGALALV